MDRETFPLSGMDAVDIKNDFLRYFCRTLGRDGFHSAPQYQLAALALTVRERLMERSNSTRHTYRENDQRQLCYLSLEYLIGRSLRNALANLGLTDAVSSALDQLGLSLEEIAELEHDAGLGNGGLGRLAACFLDSCATLQLPVIAYGIHYKYGMFYQEIEDGYQVEEPDNWMQDGHPWEVERREFAQRIQFGGNVEHDQHKAGASCSRWLNTHDVLAIPYDVPVPGYRNGTVNTLRLWSAAATDEFDLAEFHTGSYPEAVAAKNAAENITMVLYPNDASENGKELRLRQQYFLASASLKDTLRRHGPDLDTYAEKHCFQLNDTHPSIAVAELMRLLLDEHGMNWEQAWEITTHIMAYTNHTLLPEALEQWPVRLFERLLPRPLEIIYEINEQFLKLVDKRWPGDLERRRRMSLIGEGEEPMVRMAYLAIVGCFSVNGVAKLHSRLLTEGLFRDFFELWPKKFNNKTNGVTHRRWLLECNPALSGLISDTIGDGWITDLDQLRGLAPYADDGEFRSRWLATKQANKRRLAAFIRDKCGVDLDPAALFDVQVKRIHEYKRQLLNVLHVIHLYDRIKRGDVADWVPRCVLIGGKAAPGYVMAKLIIKVINEVAHVVNADPATRGLLTVAFVPNYGVSAMEVLCPGTDLSEQISTAGKEASGTGNMKFMMNGAVTIGTLDGANIEIREAVGEENFFLFGLTAEEIGSARLNYDPMAIISANEDLARVVELLDGRCFDSDEPGIFTPIVHSITDPHDPWMTTIDFAGFVAAQRRAAAAYREREAWIRMSILNTAASGRFSSDRTIREYNEEIWNLNPVAPVVGVPRVASSA